VQSIISPNSFLKQRATLEHLTEKAAQAAELAAKAEQHQRLILAVMKEVMVTATRLANAEIPFIGGDLRLCVLADEKTELGEQACWPLYRGRYGLVVLSAAEAHLTAWSLNHEGHVILTTESFNALEAHTLKAMLEELKAIAPSEVKASTAWRSPSNDRTPEDTEE
jgi:hypothetical protein